MPKVKIAGAPISWGVCEVPGWGPMLPAPRVLREMQSLGLAATELGSPGFLPTDPAEVKGLLDAHDLALIGGFVPVVLHDRSVRTENLEAARATCEMFAAAGGSYFVSAVVVDPGWAPRYALSSDEWSHLFDMLGEIDTITADYGITQVIHPHVNTLIETAADVQMVLDNTATKWCLDTGHLAIGGFDPVQFSKEYSDRVAMVHLKDVALDMARRLNAGEFTLMGATLAGMFRSLGRGDVDVAAVITNLLAAGFDQWFVLEQDTSLSGDFPPEGTGPVEDVAVSLQYVRDVVASFEAS